MRYLRLLSQHTVATHMLTNLIYFRMLEKPKNQCQLFYETWVVFLFILSFLVCMNYFLADSYTV